MHLRAQNQAPGQKTSRSLPASEVWLLSVCKIAASAWKRTQPGRAEVEFTLMEFITKGYSSEKLLDHRESLSVASVYLFL